MKSKEINKLSKDEMEKKVNQIKKDLFNMRFKRSNGPVEDTSKFSLLRKDLAKILTKINKKN
jgi:large subunit ribosomal protein L29